MDELTARANGGGTFDDPRLVELRRKLEDVEARLDTLRRPPTAPTPAANGTDSGVSADAGDDARARLDAALDALRLAAADGPAAPAVADFAAATASLFDDQIPLARRRAAVADLARHRYESLRDARLAALLDSDESAVALRSEIALRQRELRAAGAALDGRARRNEDGAERSLRQTLRISSDRLTLRQQTLGDAAEADATVAASRREAEAADAALRRSAGEDRKAFAAAAAVLDENLSQAGRSSDALAGPATDLARVLRSAVRERTARTPAIASLWSDDVAPLPLTTRHGITPASAVLASAAQPGTSAAPVSERALEAQAADLRREIDQREAELRGQSAASLNDVRSDLSKAESTAETAKADAQVSRQQLGEADARRQAAERDAQQLAQLRSRKSDLEQQKADLIEKMTGLQQSLAALAVPEVPTDADVSAPAVKDERPTYLAVSTVGLAALFLAALFLTLRHDGR